MLLSCPEGPKETSVIFYKHQEDLIQVPKERQVIFITGMKEWARNSL